MSTVLVDPAKMIAKGAPHVIHNDQELEAYTNALFQLTALAHPSRSEREAVELLTLLIERYEERHYPVQPRTRFPSFDSSSNNSILHSAIWFPNSGRKALSPCSWRGNGNLRSSRCGS